jgi:hypothetical protein
MPPHGLYKVPGNHLYPSSEHAVRPIFNTMDFQDDEPAGGKAKMVIDEAVQMVADTEFDDRASGWKDPNTDDF